MHSRWTCRANVQISCWPGGKALQIFDADVGKAIRESTTNPLLAKSWDEAISCEEGNREIGWWKEKLSRKEKASLRAGDSQATKNEKGLRVNADCDETKSNQKLCGSRKRKGTPDFKFPPGYARVEADDDEGGDLFLPLAKEIAGPRIKNEFSDSVSTEIDALYENPDRTYSRHKRGKLGITGRSSVPAHGRSRHRTPKALHIPGLTNLQATKTPLDLRSTPSLLAADAE